MAAILVDVGYDDATIDRVQRIIRKEGLGTDPAVQTHEDALCLVFLETQLAATVDDLGDEKMLDVIRKTAAKMSDRALGLVGDLPMRARDRALIGRALAPEQRRSGWGSPESPLLSSLAHADVAQLVEHNLAKVGVAGSNPVVRSKEPQVRGSGPSVVARRS